MNDYSPDEVKEAKKQARLAKERWKTKDGFYQGSQYYKIFSLDDNEVSAYDVDNGMPLKLLFNPQTPEEIEEWIGIQT